MSFAEAMKRARLGKDASWQNIAGYTTCPESEAKSEPNSPFIWNSTRRFRWRQGL